MYCKRQSSSMLLLRLSQTKWWRCAFDIGFYRGDECWEWYARHVCGWLGAIPRMVCEQVESSESYVWNAGVMVAVLAECNGTHDMWSGWVSEWHARHAGGWLTGAGWWNGMRVVTDKNGMLEMSIINVIFLTNVENCAIFGLCQLLTWTQSSKTSITWMPLRMFLWFLSALWIEIALIIANFTPC